MAGKSRSVAKRIMVPPDIRYKIEDIRYLGLYAYLISYIQYLVSVNIDINQKQRYNKRAYGQRFIKGGRPWNLEVVPAHPAEVA